MSLLDNINNQEIEEETTLSSKDIPKIILDPLFEIYTEWLQGDEVLELNQPNISKKLKGLDLHPELIEAFSVHMKKYKQEPNFINSGIFISKMIQQAHSINGHNGFKVHSMRPINYIAYGLYGYSTKIDIDLYGNAGDFVGADSFEINLSIHGDLGLHAANNARYCDFRFFGNAMNPIGVESENCNYYFKDANLINKISDFPDDKNKLFHLIDGQEVKLR